MKEQTDKVRNNYINHYLDAENDTRLSSQYLHKQTLTTDAN